MYEKYICVQRKFSRTIPCYFIDKKKIMDFFYFILFKLKRYRHCKKDDKIKTRSIS